MGKQARERVLRVRIGPSVETLCTYHVNKDAEPQYVESPFFAGNVTVRVRDFAGVTPSGAPPTATSAYFGTRRRLFSIQVAGRFRQRYDGDDVVFGAVFDRKVSPPALSWIALKCARMIDPALESDLYGERPWFLSPLVCSMNAIAAHAAPQGFRSLDAAGPERLDGALAQFPRPAVVAGLPSGEAQCHLVAPDPETLSEPARRHHQRHHGRHKHHGTARRHHHSPEHQSPEEAPPALSRAEMSLPSALAEKVLIPGPRDVVGPWQWGGEAELREQNELLCGCEPGSAAAASVADRRKQFGRPDGRRSVVFDPENVYHFDMFAPFINMNTFDLSLGMTVNIANTLNGQPIRLEAKSRATGIVFFVIEFSLEDAASNGGSGSDGGDFEDAVE